MKKTTKYILMFIGAIVLVIFLFWLNGYTAKCNEGSTFDNTTQYCFHNAPCVSGEIPQANFCYLKKAGFMNNGNFIALIIVLVIAGVGFAIWHFYKKGVATAKGLSEFDMKDYVKPDRAEKIIIEEFVRKNNIYYNVDSHGFHYKEGAINIINKREPFIKKNQERFFQFTFEANEGNEVGIFTVISSLSRGEEWIKGGNYTLMHETYDEHKEAPVKRPLYQLKDKDERKIEMLVAQGKSDEAEKILMESNSDEESATTPEEEQEENMSEEERSAQRRLVDQRKKVRFSRRNRRY